MNPLQDDTRYKVLMKKIGLPNRVKADERRAVRKYRIVALPHRLKDRCGWVNVGVKSMKRPIIVLSFFVANGHAAFSGRAGTNRTRRSLG